MKTIETLNQEKQTLLTELRAAKTLLGNDEIIEKLNKVDAEISEIKKAKLIDRINKEQERKRNFALQAWECEQPLEDFTNSDGGFHKVKVKKYPKLAALEYASAKFKDGLMLELKVNGYNFDMFKTTYEYNKPNVYTRPETFEAFLKLNSVMLKDMTIKEFNETSEKLKAANLELDKQIEAYKAKLDTLNISSLSYFGFVGQDNKHLYTYSFNNG